MQPQNARIEGRILRLLQNSIIATYYELARRHRFCEVSRQSLTPALRASW